MPKRQRLQISADDLAAAWRHRRRNDWPATFEAAMADPLLSRLVRSEAVRKALARARAVEGCSPTQRAAAAPRQRQPQQPLAPQLDRKRLAAGDSIDD